MKTNKWDQRFIDLASHIASWSKDSSRKVGAVIVDSNKHVISMGYNGFPSYIPDVEVIDKDLKNILTTHAEINALSHANLKTIGSYQRPFFMYVTHQPCYACSVHIANTRDLNNNLLIEKVFYQHDGSKTFCERHRTKEGSMYLIREGIIVEKCTENLLLDN